jgi:hypothetical protein
MCLAMYGLQDGRLSLQRTRPHFSQSREGHNVELDAVYQQSRQLAAGSARGLLIEIG